MADTVCQEASPAFLQKLDELVAEELSNSRHRDYPIVLSTAMVRRAAAIVKDFGGKASIPALLGSYAAAAKVENDLFGEQA